MEVAMTSQESDRWCSFQNRFMDLAREEQGRADVVTSGKVLRAMSVVRIDCRYEKRPKVLETEKPEQGFCLLETPQHGVWGKYGGVISENFRERVRLCAAEAGRTLPDYPQGADPEDFWLHRLYFDLLKNNSDSLFAASDKGGLIVSVCVASATFCARLAREAFANTEPSNGWESLSTGINQAVPSPAHNSGKTATSVGADGSLSRLAQKGHDFLQVRDELKQIKHLARQRKLSMPEIRTEHPDLLVWTFADSLPPEDREVFEHPGRWEPGYPAEVFLAKYYSKSHATMKKWAKAYRKELGQKAS